MEYICTKSFTSKSGDYYVIGKVITRRSNFDISKLIKLIEIQNAIELLKQNNK